MNQTVSSINDCCPVEEIMKGEDWMEFQDTEGNYTSVELSLGRKCREWPDGEANVEAILEQSEIPGAVFTDGSVHR